MDCSKERRGSARQTALENRAIVAWGEGADLAEYGVTVGNVSQTGVLLFADGRVEKFPDPVWIRLDVPKATEWVQGTVVATRRPWGLRQLFGGSSFRRVHLKFVTGCPYDFYIAATHGCALDEKGLMPPPVDVDIRKCL